MPVFSGPVWCFSYCRCCLTPLPSQPVIFVVAEELIPESQRKGNVDLAAMGVIAGFAIMMTLDVALG